jgi:hypothetical protein
VTLYGIDYEGNPVTLECKSITLGGAYDSDNQSISARFCGQYYATEDEAREEKVKQLRAQIERNQRENYEAGELLLKITGLDKPKSKRLMN